MSFELQLIISFLLKLLIIERFLPVFQLELVDVVGIGCEKALMCIELGFLSLQAENEGKKGFEKVLSDCGLKNDERLGMGVGVFESDLE